MEIKIEHVSKKFGDFTALDDISLTIADGELFFLLGPSGCGKTTLLRCLGGFEQPTMGRILLGGLNAFHLFVWPIFAKRKWQQPVIAKRFVVNEGMAVDSYMIFIYRH